MRKFIIYLLSIICFTAFSINVFAFDINGVKLGSSYSEAKSKIKSIKNVDKRFGNDKDGYFEMLGMMFVPVDEDVIYFNHGGIAVFSDSNNKVFAFIIIGKDVDLLFNSYKLNAAQLAKKISIEENTTNAYVEFPKMDYIIRDKNLQITINNDKTLMIVTNFHYKN